MVIRQEPQCIFPDMNITGTHFNYYQLCRRKLWLFANGINMEQESDLVHEGKLVHDSSYPQRTTRYEEVEIDGIKVDYYDVKNILVLQNAFEKTRKQMKVNALSINALSYNLNFPMFAKLTLKKT